MKILFLLLIATLVFCSCDKHLDVKTFKSNDISVKWYRISRITTLHDYVDIERWGHTKNILEANEDGIYDILIKADTVIILTTANLVIYELSAKTLNCYIKHDTSITTYQYLKKYRPESAEAFNDSPKKDSLKIK
jgi:hypothetical protein